MLKYFIYARKSTDEKDRQILSLDSQLNELREYVIKENLEIIEELIESRTAKQPGRRFFNYMMRKIEMGNAGGILAWHPDRLARNSIDGGKIIYLIDKELLKDLRFPTYRFDNSAQGKFMLNIAFGQSKYYIDNLSENVKRGIREKLRRGQWPGWAPLGYLNDYKSRTIIVDEDKAMLVRKMLEVFAKGDVSVAELHRQVKKWDLLGKTGKPVCKAVVDNLLRNPFYYGMIRYKNELYEGSHPPLIQKSIFDKVQDILCNNRHPKIRGRFNWEYTGLIRCGECGRMITAENHNQYTYYRCTKKSRKCSQRYIRQEALLSQIRNILIKIYIDDETKNKIFVRLNEYYDKESKASLSLSGQIESRITQIDEKIERLIDLYISEEISDKEYQAIKGKLLNEKLSLKEEVGQIEKGGGWLEKSKGFITTCNTIASLTSLKNPPPKKDFLNMVGSNYTLLDGSLSLTYSKPFDFLARSRPRLDWRARQDSNLQPMDSKSTTLSN